MESKVRTQRPVEDTQEEVVQVGPKGVYHMDNSVVSVASQPVGPYDHQDPVVIKVAGEHDVILGTEYRCQLEAGSLGGGGAVPEVFALNNWPGNAASRRNGYAALGQSDCFENWRSENNSAVVDLLHAINQVQILELGGRKHKFIGPVPRLKVKVA